MATPAFLQLKTVTCFQTEDLTGSDDLVGQLGKLRFSIGEFSDDQTSAVDIEQPIPAGVTTLQIIERDLIDPNDVLGEIDLTVDLDTERTVGILADGRGRYNITLLVISKSD